MKNTNEMVSTLVQLQKRGVQIHLTDAGWNIFLKMMSEVTGEIAAEVESDPAV